MSAAPLIDTIKKSFVFLLSLFEYKYATLGSIALLTAFNILILNWHILLACSYTPISYAFFPTAPKIVLSVDANIVLINPGTKYTIDGFKCLLRLSSLNLIHCILFNTAGYTTT